VVVVVVVVQGEIREPDRIFTTAEVAELAGVSPGTITRKVEFMACTAGLFHRETLDLWIRYRDRESA
jgi:hypothetical protein